MNQQPMDLPTGQAVGTRRHAIVLMLVATLPTMAIAGLVPVLPTLFARFREAPHAELLVPMILTLPSLCVALFASPIGVAADRWGRRPVLLTALVAFAVCGLIPLAMDGLYAVLVSRFIVGIAEGALLTVGNSLLGDYFPQNERKRWLALQTAIGPFVSSAYILFGGFLGAWSWRGPFALYALGLVFLVPAILILREPPRASPDAQATAAAGFPWRTATRVGAVTLLFATVFFVQNVQHGRIFGDLGVHSSATIGWVVTLASMGTVVGGWAYHRLGGRGVEALLAVSFLAYGLSYAGLAVAPNLPTGFTLDALGQFGSGVGLPALIAWALASYKPEHRARGMGLWASCLFLGQFVSPPVLTAIAHGRLSFLHSVGVLGMICLVVAAYAFVRARRS